MREMCPPWRDAMIAFGMVRHLLESMQPTSVQHDVPFAGVSGGNDTWCWTCDYIAGLARGKGPGSFLVVPGVVLLALLSAALLHVCCDEELLL